MTKKSAATVASLTSLFGPPEELELSDGSVVPVRPFDALGFELFEQIQKDPDTHGMEMWDLAAAALPTAKIEVVRRLTFPECMAVLFVAAGRIRDVQAFAERISGNAGAPTTAELETPRSSSPSDTSALPSPETAVAP
jgi:hypothetical protein